MLGRLVEIITKHFALLTILFTVLQAKRMKHTPVKRHEHDLPPNRTPLEVKNCSIVSGCYIRMKYQIDPTSGPKDMFGQSPNVLDVGPSLFARPRPSQVTIEQ